MAEINGIGGVFIFSNDPARLAAWYAGCFGFEFLGSETDESFWQVFVALDPADPRHKLDTTFAIMRAKAPFSRPTLETEPESMYGDQPFMINLRTIDLEGLLVKLEEKGVAILQRADEPYGKFAWVRDPDGNRVELYQYLKDAD